MEEYGARLSSTIGDPNFTSLMYVLGIFGVISTTGYIIMKQTNR